MGADNSVNAPFAYDLFLSYVNADHAWVEEYLIPALEVQTRLIPLLKAKCELPLRSDFRVQLDCTDPTHWASQVAGPRDLLNHPPAQPERIECPYPGMIPFSE